jgi:hypothetical protein
MKRLCYIIGMVIVLLGFTPSVYAWGSAIHAYIGERLGQKGILEANVVYGQMAADSFNFMFEVPIDQSQYLYAVTHGFTPLGLDTVLPVLKLANTDREKAAAFGFVTHNNVNGADVTAHGFPYNDPSGYVIAKALELNQTLGPRLEQAGLDLPEGVLMEVSHTLVEYAADLLIRKHDRAIGARMLSAAITRDAGFPNLLAAAYAPGFASTFPAFSEADARLLIISEEAKFRRLMINYGTLLQYGDEKAKAEVINFLADIAPAFLKAYGVEIQPDLLLPIIKLGIEEALILCKSDLIPTVESTINNLKAIDWYAL